jgi:taurine dioxygenase
MTTTAEPTEFVHHTRRPDRVQGPVDVSHESTEGYEHVSLAPLTPGIGAEVSGIDLGEAMSDAVLAELNRALLDWKVLVFRDQDIDAPAQIAFARHWGEVERHPFIRSGAEAQTQRFEKGVDTRGFENEWHTDNSWREKPSLGSVLRAIEVPPVGGDTLFANMADAYDNLPDEVKERIAGLVAEHDWIQAFGVAMDDETKASFREDYPTVHHPVVRTHPETGRKTLFVNTNFTRRVLDMDPTEGNALLHLLYQQADRPEVQCRVRWQPGTVVMWDNRAVQHYAASDYYPARRVMERVAIVGDTPV